MQPCADPSAEARSRPGRAAPGLPSTEQGFFLLLRLLFLAGLIQGLSGFPFLLRNFFLTLDSELWGGGRAETQSMGSRHRGSGSCRVASIHPQDPAHSQTTPSRSHS